MAKAKTKETTIAEESATQAENISGAEFREIPLAKIRTSPTNPRKHFPEEAINEMAESIKLKGVMQPILVRPAAHIPEDELEIVAGECRYRASVIAGMDTIPAIVRQLTDLEALELQVMENLHRNNLTALEEAFGFKQLLDKSQDLVGFTIEDLAAKIGKSRTYIYDSLKLTELPEKAITAFNSGDLDRSTALLVARLEPEDQDTAIGELVNREDDQPKFSYREAKAKIDEIVQTSAQKREAEAKLDQARTLVAQMEAEGKTVVLLDTVEKKEEWCSRYGGFSYLEYGYIKSGYCTPKKNWNIPNCSSFKVKQALSEEEYPDKVYLVDAEGATAVIMKLDQVGALIEQKIAAGTFTPDPLPVQGPSKWDMQKAEEERRKTLLKAIAAKIKHYGIDPDLQAILINEAIITMSEQYDMDVVMEALGMENVDPSDYLNSLRTPEESLLLLGILASMPCLDTEYSWESTADNANDGMYQRACTIARQLGLDPDISDPLSQVGAEPAKDAKPKAKGKAKAEAVA
jgi:ParB/RepB/Spo0J family partition protein